MTKARKLIGAGLVGALLAGTAGQSAAVAAERRTTAFGTAQAQTYPGEGFSQYYGGGRRYYGGRRRGNGGAVAAGVIGGLAVGALAGAAIAGSRPAYGYGYGPGPGAPVGYGVAAPVGNVYGHDPNWVNYCASRYRSFDPASGTYLANDGYRYPCQ